MITIKNRPIQIWEDQGTEFAGEFKNFCCAEGREIHSTMSETKAAFAERTIRSLKNNLYRYMEDYEYKYIHKVPQLIVTRISRNNRSINIKHNHFKNSDFMTTPYIKTLREWKKPKFGIGDRVGISKYDLPIRKVYKPKYTNEIFDIAAIAAKKPPTYTIKKRTRRSFTWDILREGNDESHLRMDLFTVELVSNESSQLFLNKTLSHLQIFARASQFGRTMGGSNFREFLPINVPKRYTGEIYVS